MISIILILLFVFSVLSVPVCHGVISGLYLYGMKIFPGLFISFILTNILVRILQQKNINNPWILVITVLMTGFPNGAYICSWYNKNNPENRLGDMLAGIINIPSPAFLISYVYINILEKCISLPMFLALTYTPVILCSYMVILLFRDKDNKKVCIFIISPFLPSQNLSRMILSTPSLFFLHTKVYILVLCPRYLPVLRKNDHINSRKKISFPMPSNANYEKSKNTLPQKNFRPPKKYLPLKYFSNG